MATEQVKMPRCGCRESERAGLGITPMPTDDSACLYGPLVTIHQRAESQLREAKELIRTMILESGWLNDSTVRAANDWLSKP